MELRVTEMNLSEEIMIRTQFSNYSFRVTDPVQCRGILRGGLLGSRQHDVIFVETLLPPNSDQRASPFLETGGRAVFLVGLNNPNRITTSYISEIYLSPMAVISSRASSNTTNTTQF